MQGRFLSEGSGVPGTGLHPCKGRKASAWLYFHAHYALGLVGHGGMCACAKVEPMCWNRGVWRCSVRATATRASRMRAAILGITPGKHRPKAVGKTVCDAVGNAHPGIIQFPVPVLRGNAAQLKALREKLYTPAFAGLTAIDFTRLAQGCKTYAEFTEKMAAAPAETLEYLGIAICGGKKAVNRLTGNLPLLR